METRTSVATIDEKESTYIPDDIVFSILSKLTLKSLKRFECVRKSWSLLFQNHRFINMFRNNFLTSSHRCSYYDGASLLLKNYGHGQYNLYSLSGEKFEHKVKLDCLDFFPYHYHTQILDNFSTSCPIPNYDHTRIFGFGSINGTLCIHDYTYYGETTLWNLATRTIKVLPPSQVIKSLESSVDIAKYIYKEPRYTNKGPFDTVTSLHGFGYDDLIDDYKVIRYVSIIGVYMDYGYISLEKLGCEFLHPFWEIYSLRSNLWKKLDVHMPSSSSYIEGTQVYMNGVCHWLSDEDSIVGRCLVSFYLSNEVFFITPTPSHGDYFEFVALWIKLVVLNGSIALISCHEDTTIHISILGEFGMKESWTKLLIVGPLPCVGHPIGVGMQGEIFFVREDEEIVWLDLSTQMIVELGYKGVACSSRIIIYKESVFPIGGTSNL